jgi:hypothetical protein
VGGAAEYQFFWTGPNGHFRTAYRASNQLALTLQGGRYQVQVYALTRTEVEAHQWTRHVWSTLFNYQVAAASVAHVKIAGPTNASLQAGAQNVTFSATALASSNVNLMYQFVVANTSGMVMHATQYSTDSSATMMLPTGKSSVWVNVLSTTAVANRDWSRHVSSAPIQYNIHVSGSPAAVTLTPAETTLPADGKATDLITADVADASGNTLPTYTGTIQVMDSVGNGTTYGLMNSQGTFVAAETPTTFAVVDGMARFRIGASDSVGQTQTLTTAMLNPAPSGGSVHFGTVAVTEIQPVATGLMLSARPASLNVSKAAAATTVTVSEDDSAGNPVVQSVDTTLTLTGPGSFSAVASDSSRTIDLEGSRQVTVYASQGASGTITVTAQGKDVTTDTLAIAVSDVATSG